MKKTILLLTTIATLSFAFASNEVEQTLNVKNVNKSFGKTYVTFERHYKDATSDFSFGEFTRSFNGSLSNEEIVTKGSYLTDGFITVVYGQFKKQGQSQVLAEKRHEAFMRSLKSYFEELDRQIANEL